MKKKQQKTKKQNKKTSYLFTIDISLSFTEASLIY